MKKIYTRKKIEREEYLLAEHVDNYGEAQRAAAEYRTFDLYARVERDDKKLLYYIWTRPGRQTKIRLLPGEVVKRKGFRSDSRGPKLHKKGA